MAPCYCYVVTFLHLQGCIAVLIVHKTNQENIKYAHNLPTLKYATFLDKHVQSFFRNYSVNTVKPLQLIRYELGRETNSHRLFLLMNERWRLEQNHADKTLTYKGG